MKEKVELSGRIKKMTLFFILLMILVGGLFPLYILVKSQDEMERFILMLVLIIVAVSLVSTLVFRPLWISIEHSKLVLKKGIGRLVINIDDIKEISSNGLGAGHSVRMFGIGGVFGEVGKYYHKSIGMYTSYVGDYRQSFLITTKKGKKYLFSCRNSGQMQEEIRRRIENKK